VSGNRDWDKELAKIDKQLESVSDAQLFPEKKGASPAQKVEVADARASASSWPAIIRLALSVALGVGILFWPYANRCGIGLGGYLFAVAAVAGGGLWSAVWTWKHRAGRAHALSILLIVWGLTLGAMEVLPRTGYAKQSLPWSCTP
jgi:predicted membrane-bound mannosyltransferase